MINRPRDVFAQTSDVDTAAAESRGHGDGSRCREQRRQPTHERVAAGAEDHTHAQHEVRRVIEDGTLAGILGRAVCRRRVRRVLFIIWTSLCTWKNLVGAEVHQSGSGPRAQGGPLLRHDTVEQVGARCTRFDRSDSSRRRTIHDDVRTLTVHEAFGGSGVGHVEHLSRRREEPDPGVRLQAHDQVAPDEPGSTEDENRSPVADRTRPGRCAHQRITNNGNTNVQARTIWLTIIIRVRMRSGPR
jgi:hypothetical protein